MGKYENDKQQVASNFMGFVLFKEPVFNSEEFEKSFSEEWGITLCEGEEYMNENFDEVTETPYFLFLREGEECFKTISTFSKGSRNYTENQKVLNILLIEFINTKLNSSSVIYKNPNYI